MMLTSRCKFSCTYASLILRRSINLSATCERGPKNVAVGGWPGGGVEVSAGPVCCRGGKEAKVGWIKQDRFQCALQLWQTSWPVGKWVAVCTEP